MLFVLICQMIMMFQLTNANANQDSEEMELIVKMLVLTIVLMMAFARKTQLVMLNVNVKSTSPVKGVKSDSNFQPKTQKIAYIAGGIGGIVAILILIVIIVWMICFRFSSKPEESELNNDKSPVPAETASDHGLGSDNFMYGRPTPVGAPAANNRSIGYYYEDEDEYDMKTMYINDGYDGGPADKASTAGGSQANKEEMFERLRRMNQHMYRPKQGSSESGQSEHEADEARTAH